MEVMERAFAMEREGADIVGLSALMTTTMVEMVNTIDCLRKNKVNSGVIIGGAVTTRAFADSIGADGYAKDAMSAVPEIKKILAARAKG